jgi:plasmid replication initiation protein
MKTSITVEKTQINETWEINICSMAKYNKNEGYINIKFTDDIMPYLLDNVVKRFTIYNLKEISNFGSLYTTRLYELIQDFKETGWLQKSITELRQLFATADRFPLYADFKKKTFDHACKEINNNYEIDLKFTEIKQGRKVVAIRFTFKKSIPKKVFNKLLGKESLVYNSPKPKRKKIISKNIKVKKNIIIEKSNISQASLIDKGKNLEQEGNNNHDNFNKDYNTDIKENKNAFISFLKRFLS